MEAPLQRKLKKIRGMGRNQKRVKKQTLKKENLNQNNMGKRKVVVPGEVIAEGDKLPGEGTKKKGKQIIAMRYGLADESAKLIKIIPLSGVYHPRRGNMVIGKVDELTFNGWRVDIDAAESAFLSLTEVPRFVNKNNLEEVMDIGDVAVFKIQGVNKRGVDLTIKSRSLGKIDEGIIIKINSNKVPRVIGKEGSMIKLIKENTGCNITVGQNGLVWIKGDKIDNELLAKKAIIFVTKKSFISGLTEEVEKWFEENKPSQTKASKTETKTKSSEKAKKSEKSEESKESEKKNEEDNDKKENKKEKKK
ncbi:RNA-binding protein [Candidatus Pacearchaeota archaeon]|nr:RNA-binding protein [Candidatus Pacearchaeota archaeon]